MKTKVFFICVMIVLIAMFYLPFNFAQDLPLPEGVRARIGGKFRCPYLDGSIAWIPVVHLWDFNYLPDSRRLVVVDTLDISFYDADTAEKSFQVSLWHGHDIRAVVVSPDGKKYAVGSLSGDFDVRSTEHWEPRSGAYQVWERNSPTYVPIAWLQESGHLLATVIETLLPEKPPDATGFPFSSVIHVSNWEGSFREAISEHKPELYPSHGPRVENVGFHGSEVASVSNDSIIHIWESAAHTRKFMSYHQAVVPDGNGGTVSRIEPGSALGLTLSPNNLFDNLPERHRNVSVMVIRDYYMNPPIPDVYQWPLDSIRHPANTINLYEDDRYGRHLKHTFIGHTGCVWNVAYSEDGQWVASASADDTIRIWNPRVGHEVQQFNSCTLHLSNLAFSPDGKMLAIGQWDGKVILSLSDSMIGASVFEGHTGPVTSVAFHPKLPILASVSTDGNLQIWSFETASPAEIKHNLLNHNAPLTSVAFSPDGRKLAVGKWARNPGTTLDVLEWNGWHVVGEPLGVTYQISDRLQLDKFWESVVSVAFSPDSRTLAAGGPEGDLQLWSMDAQGDIIGLPRRLAGHKDSVFKVMFSSDGRTLASGSDDGAVLLWDHEPAPGWKPSDPVEFKPGDVNGDAEVNLQDLIFVNTNLGATGVNPADVNGDGVVDIQDVLLVADALDEAAAAPAAWYRDLEIALTRTQVAQWLTQAQQLSRTEGISQGGIRFLEEILAALTPQETALLANYPNPFNPETWIPYQLAVPADVTVRIYAMDGSLIRALALGYQAAGIYQSRSRAAYWDGKNELGEPVASGPYFYTLTAGGFSATRKLLIQK